MKGVNKTQKLHIELLKCSIGRGEQLARELITNKDLWQSFIVVSDEHKDNNLMLIAHENVYLRMNAISFLVKRSNIDKLTEIIKKYDHTISSVREIKHLVDSMVITYHFNEFD